MKIPLHHSLKVAHKVLKLIDLPKNVARECGVESWANCREQGLSISATTGQHVNWIKINIAECRSSDNILVIVGNYRDFDNQKNHPTEELWNSDITETGKGRKFFNYNEEQSAADFITSVILNSFSETEMNIQPEKEKIRRPRKTKVRKTEPEKEENIEVVENLESMGSLYKQILEQKMNMLHDIVKKVQKDE